jgi:hypothetical protein
VPTWLFASGKKIGLRAILSTRRFKAPNDAFDLDRKIFQHAMPSLLDSSFCAKHLHRLPDHIKFVGPQHVKIGAPVSFSLGLGSGLRAAGPARHIRNRAGV